MSARRQEAPPSATVSLVGRSLTTILLVLAVPAVVLPVATEDPRNAAVGVGAFELAGQADVDIWTEKGTQ